MFILGAIYSQVLLYWSLIYHSITYDTAITVAESGSDIRITTDTLYLTLTGELWGFYCEDLGENWQCYNGTALYLYLEYLDRVYPKNYAYGSSFVVVWCGWILLDFTHILQVYNAVRDILPLSLQCCIWYYDILDRVMKAPNCTMKIHIFHAKTFHGKMKSRSN